MAKAQSGASIAVVSGDLTLDWNLARTGSQSGSFVWPQEGGLGMRAFTQAGGSALLGRLVGRVSEQLAGKMAGAWRVRRQAEPVVDPTDRSHHHSFAQWTVFSLDTRSSGADSTWRVEQFLGVDAPESEAEERGREWSRVVDDSAEAKLVVLDDAGLGFRSAPEVWPLAIQDARRRPWVLLKSASPVADGALWSHLLDHFADRLIVVMTVGDLRRSDSQISRGLSWERTAQDLAWELVHNQAVNGLSRCAHVVVTFDTTGAFLLNGGEVPNYYLIFDPTVMEGEWGAPYPGRAIGYTASMTTSVAASVMRDPSGPDLDLAVQRGLAAMRRLEIEGYPEMLFPLDAVTEEILDPERSFSVVRVRDPVRPVERRGPAQATSTATGSWRILHERYPEGLVGVAETIARLGAERVLEGVPLGRFGKLLTVDREEIEGFRSVGALISEYARKTETSQPLSIAVFGAPGSGKSFGIVEVAESLLPDLIKRKTFNLSQFRSRDDLLSALHQVRDISLSGKLPLIFWDEFDSTLGERALGWLAYFLAPMQDGEFQQGQVTHSIGRAIFVFAGGTSWKMVDFGTKLDADPEKNDRLFVAAKGPDFVSRLKGHVNIMGPNPRDLDRNADPFYIVRRAILLRALLWRHVPALFDGNSHRGELRIDAGVLRSLLRTWEYRHGARSMEAIIAMSALEGRRRFERSSLPPEQQLELHVDAVDFIALVQEATLTPELTDRLAATAHEIWMAGRKRDGFRYGKKKSEEKKTHPLLVPYAELPEDGKEANRVNVRSIPRKLAAVDFVMIPARSNDPAFEFPGGSLEQLAELEHEIWMEAKLADGWKLGKATPEDPKRNEYLVPWDEVPPDIQQSDKDLVAGIPEILSKAGYTIVRPGRAQPSDGQQRSAQGGTETDE